MRNNYPIAKAVATIKVADGHQLWAGKGGEGKVKVNVDFYSLAPCCECDHTWRSGMARVLKGSQFYLHTPRTYGGRGTGVGVVGVSPSAEGVLARDPRKKLYL